MTHKNHWQEPEEKAKKLLPVSQWAHLIKDYCVTCGQVNESKISREERYWQRGNFCVDCVRRAEVVTKMRLQAELRAKYADS